ncbi:hypothetical protein LXA43DRAFT_888009, partial [Ganoderma leucocontextum]
LTQLNDDVLVKIFQELRPEEGLRHLSSTCRWLRAASAPFLFRSCRQFLGDTPWNGKTYEFLPSALWSHVRTLHISCFCPPYSQRDPDVVDPLLCDAISTFDEVLPSLPRLTTLHLRVRYIEVHGLSWKTMQKILSLPQLHHLDINGLYICPALLANDNPTDFTVASLTAFHYTMPHYRQPWSFPSEMSTLDTLIRKLHGSLESLVLPVESAPIQTISSLPWPRLREFTLRGERWSNPATPIVTLFSSMPFLRSLALELSEPENASAGVIWPKGHPATRPWPDLESLRVSHPTSTDLIYASLPPSLRGLALRSWPHEGTRIYQQLALYGSTSRFEGYKQRSWSYPLSPPQSLLQVLWQCDLPLLRSLELEYRADTQEPELLQLVVTKFPHLTTLEIHRIRSERREDVPVVSPSILLASPGPL